VDALIEGIRIVHDVTRRAPLARFVRDNPADYSHSVGTWRMGPSPGRGDVVDAGSRVHGLANVFIADASISIIPKIPRANTNLTCYVIGARATDLLARA
jgi:choline dehydrogenase-like flavoprotein